MLQKYLATRYSVSSVHFAAISATVAEFGGDDNAAWRALMYHLDIDEREARDVLWHASPSGREYANLPPDADLVVEWADHHQIRTVGR